MTWSPTMVTMPDGAITVASTLFLMSFHQFSATSINKTTYVSNEKEEKMIVERR